MQPRWQGEALASAMRAGEGRRRASMRPNAAGRSQRRAPTKPRPVVSSSAALWAALPVTVPEERAPLAGGGRRGDAGRGRAIDELRVKDPAHLAMSMPLLPSRRAARGHRLPAVTHRRTFEARCRAPGAPARASRPAELLPRRRAALAPAAGSPRRLHPQAGYQQLPPPRRGVMAPYGASARRRASHPPPLARTVEAMRASSPPPTPGAPTLSTLDRAARIRLRVAGSSARCSRDVPARAAH